MVVEILDIGSGNIKSIQNWIERLNVPTKIIKKAIDIKSEFLVLPGVGSAGLYMDRMKQGDFDKAIIEHVQKGNRILGICLGFQLMGNYSDEDGGVQGLGLIDSKVEKLKNNISHNGWERFNFKKNELENNTFNSILKLTRKQKIDGRVFFNHEYGVVVEDNMLFNKPISKELQRYSAMIVKDNIIGMQFHPEKSQQTGIEIISMIL